MNIAVVPNKDKPAAYAVCREIAELLRQYPATLLADDRALTGAYRITDTDTLYRTADFVLAVGGDGTIMHTAKRAARDGKAVVGVNAGRMGFLANLEQAELHHLQRLFTGAFEVDTRMVLSANIGDETYDFINDLVTVKTGAENLVDVTAGYAEQGIAYRADGLIIATPTGSTAYSMSAGGPILDTALDCIVVTPICSHSLFSRSVIFNANREIFVRLVGDGQRAEVVLDGETRVPIQQGSVIRVVKNRSISIRFIKFKQDAFYDILSQKIK